MNIPQPLCHLTFLLSGYYLNENALYSSKIRKRIKIPTMVMFIAFIIYMYWSNWDYNLISKANMYNSIFIFLLTINIFLYFKDFLDIKINGLKGKIMRLLSSYSFGIYLIHPFFMNVLYKAFSFIPTKFPGIVGIPLFMLIFIISSTIIVFILQRMKLFYRLT